MQRLLILFFLLFVILSCSENKPKGIYKEGKLEYRISYLNATEDNYDPSFLPKKMILEFNQDFCIFRIDGFMGMFRLGNITYFKNHRVKTHLKVLDQNYAFNGGRNEMMCCFDCFSGMIIEKDTATAEIAGLKSKKVKISFKDTDEKYDVYFTEDIMLSEPNSTNPYKKIDGILTNFRLKMGPYLMQFNAVKFTPKFTLKDEMEIPETARIVGREELVAILDRLMQQNM
jgi:predicted transcriptional regulator